MRKYNVQSLSILQQYTIPYKNLKFFAKKKLANLKNLLSRELLRKLNISLPLSILQIIFSPFFVNNKLPHLSFAIGK